MNKSSRTYDKEFKINAVKLYHEGKGGKGIEKIAADLGIPSSTLYNWVKLFAAGGADEFVGSGNIKPSNVEVYQLKRKLADVTAERDILKKALAIFSQRKP